MPAHSVSIEIYSYISRFPCDSTAFLYIVSFAVLTIVGVLLYFLQCHYLTNKKAVLSQR